MDGLAWLPALFNEVWIPPSVQREVLPGVGTPGELEIAAEIKRKSLKVWKKTIQVPSVDVAHLDEGETDCIRIALSEGVANAVILMDERAGRAVAIELGIRVTGTAAVIGFAKARFECLHASDFRISADVIQTVLRGVGELS